MTANHAVPVVAAVVFHPSIVHYQSGAVVALVQNHIAVKIAVVWENVVLSQVVANLGSHHAPLAAVANALALVLAQSVQR